MKKTSVLKRKNFWKKIPYLKEKAIEKTLLYCENEVKLLLNNNYVPKRKHFWKRLLYLKENTFEKEKKDNI